MFVLPGGQAESMYAIGLEQWRTLVPKSELLVTDLSDHKYDNHRVPIKTARCSRGAGGDSPGNTAPVHAALWLGATGAQRAG